MKFGLLNYHENKHNFNVGDYIQSLAAKQYLPQVDGLVFRDALSKFDGANLAVIMNGWFTHNPRSWIPNDNLEPLFVSFHLNSEIREVFLSREGIKYLKQHEPIGCRDLTTVKYLEEKGLDAYYSGCLTLTLDNYKVEERDRTGGIYIVDPFFNLPTLSSITLNLKHFVRSLVSGDFLLLGKREMYLRSVFDKELLSKAIYEQHVLPSKTYTDKEKFELADGLLRKYARAKLVITSRIHCALPCLAMGTPVIFLNAFDSEIDTCRFDGLTDLFNMIEFDQAGRVSSNIVYKDKIGSDVSLTNFDTYKEVAEKLEATCRRFVERVST